MLPSAHLPVGISTEECLAWSSDGEVAIAAGEEVYLLIPRYAVGEPWIHVRLRVNTFTYEEWPPQRQASFADLSIGEEQARVTVISLAWSPPGLAKHRRSVLAILTSNLLLSLWAPGGNPRDSECWQRVLIVDCKRIRSMAWAPANPLNLQPRNPLSNKKWGIPFLAVANNNDEISLLIISSPFMSASVPWKGQMLGHEAIEPVYKVNYRPSLLRDALNAKSLLDCIAFGDWSSESDISLMYRISGVLYQTMVTLSLDPVRAVLDSTRTHSSLARGYHGAPLEAPDFMQAAVKAHKIKYSNQNHVNLSDVILKTLGLASLGDLVAVCITSHPGKMVEYQALSESSATILFGNRNGTSNLTAVFPWQEPHEVDEGKVCQIILFTLFDRQRLALLNLTAFDLKILYAAICATLCEHMSDQQRLPCLDAAVSTVELLETTSGTNLEAERHLIAARKGPERANTQRLDALMRQIIDSSSASSAGLLETCSICEEGYVGLTGARERFWEASCRKRHPFGMSFTSAFMVTYVTGNL